ncbi:hypothetical protein P692DRAFT_20511939 [Suillus brevipes Sb2]|nr:hypothetical protein P692DRAFT_20511939 [Suillus brevipes Sb2]
MAILRSPLSCGAMEGSCRSVQLWHSFYICKLESCKCFRKAALAHFKRKDCAHAGSIIWRRPDAEATKQYVIVIFPIAVHQSSRAHHLIARPYLTFTDHRTGRRSDKINMQDGACGEL